jgi:transposase
VRSLTLISAITSDFGHFSQVLAGASDGVLFANFVDAMLQAVADSPKYQANPRPVLLFMDNATIHRSKVVRNVVNRRGAFAMFNAAYSPFLNPVELYFSLLKRRVRKHELTTVPALVRLVVDEFRGMRAADIKYMWRTTAANWRVEFRAQQQQQDEQSSRGQGPEQKQ